MVSATHPIQPFAFLKMLGHELRWEILTTLAHSDFRVQELVERLQQPQNLVSYHLKQLRDSHVVTEHRSTADGRDIYYSLDLRQVQIAYAAVGIALHPALSIKATAAPTPVPSGRPACILFLCTENSARSQMAEGILRDLGVEGLHVYSAGTTPSHVHPNAVQVMADRNIDISGQCSKSVDEFQDQSFDYVITVCDRARENCPQFSEATTLMHWSLPDPAIVIGETAQLEAFEQTAQALLIRIHYLVAFINPMKEAS